MEFFITGLQDIKKLPGSMLTLVGLAWIVLGIHLARLMAWGTQNFFFHKK